MRKLEDIPKKNIFVVPEGYFDRLPGIIQARVAPTSGSFRWKLSTQPVLRYALTVFFLVALGFFWYDRTHSGPGGLETELASISPAQLAIYLKEGDVTTDDLVETVSWNSGDLNELENSVYSDLDLPGPEIESILNEYDDAEL